MTSAATVGSTPVSSKGGEGAKAPLQVSTAPTAMTLLPTDAQSASPASTTSSSSAPSSAGEALTGSQAPTPEPLDGTGQGEQGDGGERQGMGSGMRRIGSGGHLPTLQSKSYRRDTLLEWHVVELTVKSKAPKDQTHMSFWDRVKAKVGGGKGTHKGQEASSGLPTTARPPVHAGDVNPDRKSVV